MNEASNRLALELIANVYPTSRLSDLDLNHYEISMNRIIRHEARWPGQEYLAKTVDAARAALTAIEDERQIRVGLTNEAANCQPGDNVVTNALQRGWPSAACADPPIGTRGVVEGPAPFAGKVMVRVHLRELGYECSEEDDEDDYKSFYLWAATLEKQ